MIRLVGRGGKQSLMKKCNKRSTCAEWHRLRIPPDFMERISAPVERNNCEALQTLGIRKELQWKGQSSWPLPSNGIPAPHLPCVYSSLDCSSILSLSPFSSFPLHTNTSHSIHPCSVHGQTKGDVLLFLPVHYLYFLSSFYLCSILLLFNTINPGGTFLVLFVL